MHVRVSNERARCQQEGVPVQPEFCRHGDQHDGPLPAGPGLVAGIGAARLPVYAGFLVGNSWGIPSCCGVGQRLALGDLATSHYPKEKEAPGEVQRNHCFPVGIGGIAQQSLVLG